MVKLLSRLITDIKKFAEETSNVLGGPSFPSNAFDKVDALLAFHAQGAPLHSIIERLTICGGSALVAIYQALAHRSLRDAILEVLPDALEANRFSTKTSKPR